MITVKFYSTITMWTSDCLPGRQAFHPRKHLIWCVMPHNMGSAQCCTHPCLSSLGQMIVSYGREGYHIMCTVIHYLQLQCLGEAIGTLRYLPPSLLVMLALNEAEKWSPQDIVPSLSVEWSAACNDMWQCKRNDPWWDQQETQGGIVSFETDGAIHNMVNSAKKEIKELKKGSSRKLIKSGTPKRLWDDCLKLESYKRSNPAHSIYKLDEIVPETIMSGKMSDISQFCEFEWFEWVMFWDKTAPYPNDHFRLGRYLGSSIDIGPALMAKITEENGHVLHRSLYQVLTQEEWKWEECNAECSSFMASLHQKLGPCNELRDLVELGVEDTHNIFHMRTSHRMPKHFPCWTKNLR